MLTENYMNNSNNDLNQQLNLFLNNLLLNQQSLGEEFEKILHDNLWELYVDNSDEISDND